MNAYHITRHAGLAGVRLSKSGHWQNQQFDSVELAEVFARVDAGSRSYTIDRKTFTRRLHEVKS